MTKPMQDSPGRSSNFVTLTKFHHGSREASSACISIHRGHAGLSSFTFPRE
ncbi:hypothetical protein [Staphylococcus capitis]|uniref:hypothetical protein n=1 Tax=Staphylococcus capitis TaxID=29388 RepID=UPI0022E44775|nr:hypothetical protein [Staphylococcus capitis]